MDPEIQAAQNMASPEQKQQLLDMIEGVRGKIGEFNTARFATQNSSDQMRRDALKEVFQALQDSGIDLTDPQAVAEFLSKLKEMNPEIAQLLEESLDSLLGAEEQGPSENMNIDNETLPQDVRGPIPPQQNSPIG